VETVGSTAGIGHVIEQGKSGVVSDIIAQSLKRIMTTFTSYVWMLIKPPAI
jgi:hypothetical protein